MGTLGGGGLLIAVSGSAAQLKDPYTELRVNTIKSKSFPTTGGFIDLATNLQVALVSPAGSTYFVVKDGSHNYTVTNTLRSTLDANGLQTHNNTSFKIFNGQGVDPRHEFNVGGYIRKTLTSGGNASEPGFYLTRPIGNGLTINVNDTVEYVPSTSNRVRSSATSSANDVIGYAVSGGTGDAGGTVMAVIQFEGYVAQFFVSDAAITYGHWISPGVTTANRVRGTAARVAGCFGIARSAAGAAGVTIDVDLMGVSKP